MIKRIPFTRVVVTASIKQNMACRDGGATCLAALYLVRPNTSFLQWMVALHVLWFVVGIGWSGAR